MDRKQQLDMELQRLVPLLRDRFQATLILIFGSVASGNVTDFSDIDLVVVRKTSLRFLDRIGELLVSLQPRVGVDFLVYTPEEWKTLSTSNQFVREEVLRKGKVLYAA